MMDQLAALSFQSYCDLVKRHPSFGAYFRALTPEPELGNLLIGSRPAKRALKGGLETLRAIPWIFAWNQCRFNAACMVGC